MGYTAFVIVCVTVCIAAVLLQLLVSEIYPQHDIQKNCWKDYELNETVCSVSCENGSFSLPGMTECHKWLGCEDSISMKHVIVQSIVKTVYLAKWKEYEVVVSELSSPEYEDDFKENLKILKMLGPNPFTVQLLGHCKNVMYTQYHRLGSALNLQYLLRRTLQSYDNIFVRFNLCINYVEILNYLHAGPIGIRVMCDSNTLEKTLSQYLLTENLGLVVNDLDALPVIDEDTGGVLCGKRPIYDAFAAPEQKWDSEQDYSPELMKPYNEKVDIWKVPDVCLWFLGNSAEADIVKFKIFSIHKSCKNEEPSKRPSASTVLDAYKKVLNDLKL